MQELILFAAIFVRSSVSSLQNHDNEIVSLYSQCGGIDWHGPTRCEVQAMCKWRSEGLSVCMPNPLAHSSCNAEFSQCGGQGWSGATCCDAPAVCVYSNDYYSQCLVKQGDGGSGGSASSTSTNSPVSITSSSTTISFTTSASSPTPTSNQPHFNPFKDADPYVNTEYAAAINQTVSKYADTLGSTFQSKAETVSKQPTAIWMDTIANIARLKTHLPLAVEQSKRSGRNVSIMFVVYNLPGRDCHALASNGEIPTGGLDTYTQQYINPIASILKKYSTPSVRVVLIIEPDSLPNIATNLDSTPKCKAAQDDYYQGVSYAIASLSTIPSTFLYLDSAHGGWLGWPDNTRKIIPIFSRTLQAAQELNSKASISGFAVNTASYSPFAAKSSTPATKDCPPPLQVQNGLPVCQGNPCIDEDRYTAQLAAAFGPAGLPARFLVDTSRNGVPSARQIWGSWCNIKGSGIGERPAVDPSPLIDAFVWVKPPGESDGVSGPPGTPRLDGFCDPTTSNGLDSLPNAPQAGVWFDAEFIMLVKNANPPL